MKTDGKDAGNHPVHDPAGEEQSGILNASRRQRIAKGSGTSVTDVNRLLKQFEDVRKMIRAFQGKRGGRLMKGMGGYRMPF